jgi:hypothetical protein
MYRHFAKHLLLCLAASPFIGFRDSLADSSDGLHRSSVIVVRPQSWADALQDWSRYRQPRYDVIEVDASESSQDLRRVIRNTISSSKSQVKAILLCGDVSIAKDSVLAGRGYVALTPTFELPTSVKLGSFTTPTLATDNLYADLDGDECPDLAVGRLPAKNASELKRMLQRSIDYEQSQSFGPWRDRVHATAGVGGFGMVADTAIETVARRLLSEGIPDRFQLQMTYASLTSPYCPDPNQLTRSFIGKINQGGLFWVYIGHGNVHHLDEFVVGNENLPICSGEHIAQFQVQDGPPVALMLACFTGAFDARIDCFAEMLLANNQGPIAVIAGSRVTMPYGLSQFSTELMDGCFQDRTETLGEIVLNAKRRIWNSGSKDISKGDKAGDPKNLRGKQQALIESMASALSPEGHDLAEERKEHVRLMNLLGDPLLRIRQPIEMPIQCELQPTAGQTVLIHGKSPVAGQLRLELALARDRLPEGINSVANFSGSQDQRETMQQNYSQASDLVLLSKEQEVVHGEFSVELAIPQECRGRCVVRAFVYGDDNWASGSLRVNVNRKR